MIRWRGTVYRLHPLFTIMILFSAVTGYFIELFTLFSIVFIHELGHAITAKAFKWRVKEVQLLPFGGVAVVDESANVPVTEEVMVTLAGPLQNVWMILLGWFMVHMEWGERTWWTYFIESNQLILLFNLLPVLPLDGGKLMQSVLSCFIPFHRTILITIIFSMIVSVMLLCYSFYGGIHLNFIMIGLFLFYSNWYAWKNAPYLFFRFLISRENRANLRIEQGVLAKPIVVNPRMKIIDILKLFMKEKYHLIYVVSENGTIRKVLPEQHIIRSYLKR